MHIMRRDRVTSNEVAKAAGVSQATVSRCFNDSQSVSPELLARVLSAARRLGYRRNALARSLVRGRSNNIAVVSGNLSNSFYGISLHEMTKKLRDVGLGTQLFTIDGVDNIDKALAHVLEQQVDGIIINAVTLDSKVLYDIISSGIPTVLFNRTTTNANVSFAASDNVA